MGRIGELGRLTKASQQICFPAYGLGPVKLRFKTYRRSAILLLRRADRATNATDTSIRHHIKALFRRA
jgi:hypothetical protein